MKYRTFGSLMVCLMVLVTAGCSKVKFYAVDRPRVDQAKLGNAGYVGGQKKYDVPNEPRKTRRIYVFEVDRKKQEEIKTAAPVQSAEAEGVSVSPAKTEPSMAPKTQLTLPYIGDDVPVSVEVAATAEPTSDSSTYYTVVKDDTLQKISKKVYGVYSKWTKIYDANKDKIKNPNFVKPGSVLTIPRE